MVKVLLAPQIRHAHQSRERIKHDCHNGERQQSNANAVPRICHVQIHDDTAHQRQPSKHMGLPPEVLHFKSPVDRGENQSEDRPDGYQPAARRFVPGKQR